MKTIIYILLPIVLMAIGVFKNFNLEKKYDEVDLYCGCVISALVAITVSNFLYIIGG